MSSLMFVFTVTALCFDLSQWLVRLPIFRMANANANGGNIDGFQCGVVAHILNRDGDRSCKSICIHIQCGRSVGRRLANNKIPFYFNCQQVATSDIFHSAHM